MNSFPLHRAVFFRNFDAVEELLRSQPTLVDVADVNGNTPLLLSIRLGFPEIAKLLLKNGACADIKSEGKFHLLDEALVSTSDYGLVREIYINLHRKGWSLWLESFPRIVEALEGVHDFYIEMKWQFKSSGIMFPLVALMAPSDTYKIWKKGSAIRVDFTIAGVGKFSLKKGNISLIFLGRGSHKSTGDGLHPSGGELLKIDRGKRTFKQVLRDIETENPTKIRRTVLELMKQSSHKAKALDMKCKNITYSPAKDKSNNAVSSKVGDWGLCNLWYAEGDVKMALQWKSKDPIKEMSATEYFGEGYDANDDPELTKLLNSTRREANVANVTAGKEDPGDEPQKAGSPVDDEGATNGDDDGDYEMVTGEEDDGDDGDVGDDDGDDDEPPPLLDEETSAALVLQAAAAATEGGEESQISTDSIAERPGQLNSNGDDRPPNFDDLLEQINAASLAESSSEGADGGPPPFPTSDEKNASASDTAAGSTTNVRKGYDEKMVINRRVKSSVYVSKSVPLSLRDFLPVLEVLATSDKNAEKLQKFLRSADQLDGFPVKTEMPLALGVNACVTFEKYEPWDKVRERSAPGFEGELFTIPVGFRETTDEDKK